MEVEKNALKIKLAARDLFRKYGFNKTSVNEIAKKANVAKATIYKYYESKELILKNIILDYLEHMFNEISQQFRNNASSPEDLAYLISKTSRVTYTACNEFIGWEFIRESTHAQEFLRNLSDQIEYILLRYFVNTEALQKQNISQEQLSYLIKASKSIVFSFAFTSVSEADVRKNFITFNKEILPFLIKGALAR
jgi:AcrR family transcriptional regulator